MMYLICQAKYRNGGNPGDLLMSYKREDLKDLSIDQFASWLRQKGIEDYRSKQVFKWVYGRQEDSFENMTNLSRSLRVRLAEAFEVRRLALAATESAKDGSRKYLFSLIDGNRIESVLIPDGSRNTLCISSQVGCPMGCGFCLTGIGGWVRDLTPGEILSQVRDISHQWHPPGRITNIVFMGMGEPLANYRNVMQALATLTDLDTGLGFSGRRITVSTAGMAPRIAEFSRETTVNLAVSLNATEDRTRSRLMPLNRKYPIQRLLEACRRSTLTQGRLITFEYVLMEGINDSPDDAYRLANLLKPIRCKINLIPFNGFSGCEFERPDTEVIDRFRNILEKEHYTVLVRNSKGQEISAACGQLRGGRT